MDWTPETRTKLARRIRELSLDIQEEEFARNIAGGANFPEAVNNTIERIMERLEPLGFKKATGWFQMERGEHLNRRGANLHLYRDSETHLWFETAQSRIVTISKEDAEKVMILGIP